jgi:hypothetical protein
MRKIEVPIYTYRELSESTRQEVRDEKADHYGYRGAEEAFKSMESLVEHFGGTIKDYDIDYFNCSYSYAKFDMPELTREEIAELLGQLGEFDPATRKGRGDCKLTGYCMDEDAIDGFRIAFLDGCSNLNKLMQAAFDSWLIAVHADCENEYADDTFAENEDASGIEYYQDGTIYEG